MRARRGNRCGRWMRRVREQLDRNAAEALAFGVDVIVGEAERAAHACNGVAYGLEAAAGEEMNAQMARDGGTWTTKGSRAETSR